jgi:MerR family transcriptional regulator, thiopeptide resistance regulator
MNYTIKRLADLAGVSVRTLHYYDQIGLLKPRSVGENGYRSYTQNELIRLQQILFFKELDFSLAEIRTIIENPDFDISNALEQHRKLLNKQISRMKNLIRTIDKTRMNLKGELEMTDNEYYQGFSKEKQEKYEEEIRQKYGHKALDESKSRMRKWSKEDFNRIMQDSEKIFTAIRDNMSRGYESGQVQSQIKELHKWLNHFYTCDLNMFMGIGHMYNEHPDFIKMYKTRYHQEMPEFLLKAIEYYCLNNPK